MNFSSIKLGLTTPLFGGGADPNGTPEFRITELRSQLRWWWRALYMGANPSTSITELKKAETDIWGGSYLEENQKTVVVASKVKMRIIENALQETGHIKFGWDGNIHDTYNPQLSYFFFFTQMKPNIRRFVKPIGNWGKNKHPGDFTNGNPEGSISIGLKIRDCADYESIQKQVWGAFFCWLYLGGLGTRARRGAGSFHLIESDQSLPFGFIQEFEDGPSYQDYVEKTINDTILPSFGQNEGDPTIDMPSVRKDAFHLYVPRTTPFSTAEEALKKICTLIQEHRFRLGSLDEHIPNYDYENSVDFALTGEWPPDETYIRAGLGLPISIQWRNNGDLNNRRAIINLNALDSNCRELRKASPLHIHIAKINQEEFIWIASYFLFEFLPQSDRLELKANGKIIPNPSPIDDGPVNIPRPKREQVFNLVNRIFEESYYSTL